MGCRLEPQAFSSEGILVTTLTDRTNRKAIISWALYDWANSAFALTVMAVFFPLFLNDFWRAGYESSTAQLGVTNSISSLVIVLLAPVVGAIADRGGGKKRFLGAFAALAIVAVATLPLVGQGEWAVALALFAVGLIGFSGANIFYDALIVNVSPEAKLERVSTLGYALGYLGGGLLFVVNAAMYLRPAWFGLSDSNEAVKVAFITVAVWWALFSLPLFLFVDERRPPARVTYARAVREGIRQLVATFHEVRHMRVVFLFLVAYWVYIDGVDTMIRMAFDYGISLGFDRSSLIIALLITQFVGFPAAIVFGLLGQRLGPKAGIYIGLLVYLGVTVWGYFMDQTWEFYVLAVAIGLVQGGVQALSRSLYARIIPANKAGEFFGFFNMMGKFAAVLGPLLMAAVDYLTGNTRLAIIPVAALFLIGGTLLHFVDEREGMRAARELERL